MLEHVNTLIGALVAIGTALSFIGRQLYTMTRENTKFQTQVLARLASLEQWQKDHQDETDKYQDILKKVEKELAYNAGIRNAASTRTVAE